MARRGDQVLVEGFGGRRAVLRVWETSAGGAQLSSEAGYKRLVAGDRDAPLVGFPASDIRRVLASESATDDASDYQQPS